MMALPTLGILSNQLCEVVHEKPLVLCIYIIHAYVTATGTVHIYHTHMCHSPLSVSMLSCKPPYVKNARPEVLCFPNEVYNVKMKCL